MTAIVSSLGLLVLSCVLLCHSMGSEGSAHDDVDKKSSPYPRHLARRTKASACKNKLVILYCQNSEHVIRVNYTCWGGANAQICIINQHSCTKASSSSDCFLDVKDRVKTQCDNQKVCNLWASTYTLGDPPCPHYFTFLEVWFTCVPATTTIQLYAYACEDNYLSVECHGYYGNITILRAYYGRSSTNRCDPHVLGINKSNRYCTNDVRNKIKKLCDNKSMCRFLLTDYNFTVSDSCDDVYKYLEVYYKCKNLNR